MRLFSRFTAVLFIVPGFIFAGCAVNKDLQATGGSRADGVVELSYEVGSFEQAVIDEQQGLQTARQRCAAWGYTNAEAFGGQKRQCQQFYQSSCVQQLVIIAYQCTGRPRTSG